jgi:hypothetical protein
MVRQTLRQLDRIVRCIGKEDRIALEFDQGETLTIWEPQGLEIGPNVFSVRAAARIRWEWYYYGRPKAPQNHYFEEFVNEGATISASTNVDWYSPTFQPSLTEKAVEIL